MGFYGELNAGQMLRFVAELNNLPVDVANNRIEEALKEVGLYEESEKKINAYPDIPIELYVAEPKYYKGLRKALRATRYQAINERLMKGLHFRKVSL